MGRPFGFGTLWLLVMAVGIQALQLTVPNGVGSECLGNMVRVSLDKSSVSIGNNLEVYAFNGTALIHLTDNLAARCGYSMKSDPWGNVKLFASLQSCFAQDKGDGQYEVALRLRMPEETARDVSQSCGYTWASREILCDRSYMEVSVRNGLQDVNVHPEQASFADETGPKTEADETGHNEIPVAAGAGFRLWKVVFFTPVEKAFHIVDARKMGYGVHGSSSRLVLRSPYNMAETYSQNVAGVPMEVFKTTTFYKDRWMVSLVDTTAACPTGGVVFTEDMITWYVPQRISPLISSDSFNILEVHMGIDGKRLDSSQMAAREYFVSITETHIVTEIPIGSADGYYKSHAPENQYVITYSIEPMLELLWMEGVDETRYKVLFPISTPPMPWSPHVTDNTVAEQKVFDVLLGVFLPDVELLNITFSTGVLTVAEANARGFNVQEHQFPNGSKTFSLQVPFSDPAVLNSNHSLEVTIYTLPLVYGLLILPERTAFSHPTLLEATLLVVVPPTVTGTCDMGMFFVTVEYGNQGLNFETVVGKRLLTPELAEQYGLKENGTHFGIAVSAVAPDVAFESTLSSAIRGRLDLALWDPVKERNIYNFSIACTFSATMTECFPDGIMTALALKLESVPGLLPSQLTLRDPSCKPVYSDDRFAYFVFYVNTCGTSRKFSNNVMLYENEVTLPDGQNLKTTLEDHPETTPDPEYRFKVSCLYTVNTTQTLAFYTRSRSNEPLAEAGMGQLLVRIRLSQDETYNHFYLDEDYPVVKYLREPLYFEVELMKSTDPKVALVLEKCWATFNEDRTSKPKWDVVVDGCENLEDSDHTIFHPVKANARVKFPTHFKRFQIKMFSFAAEEEAALRGQVFVHCDVVICDTNSPMDELCNRQCVNPQSTDMNIMKRGRRSVGSEGEHHMEHVSMGPILLL